MIALGYGEPNKMVGDWKDIALSSILDSECRQWNGQKHVFVDLFHTNYSHQPRSVVDVNDLHNIQPFWLPMLHVPKELGLVLRMSKVQWIWESDIVSSIDNGNRGKTYNKSLLQVNTLFCLNVQKRRLFSPNHILL